MTYRRASGCFMNIKTFSYREPTLLLVALAGGACNSNGTPNRVPPNVSEMSPGGAGGTAPESTGTAGSATGVASGGSEGVAEPGEFQGGGSGGAAGMAVPPVLECPPPVPATAAYALDERGVTFTLNPGQLRLDVCEDDILRVQYTTAAALPAKDSLSVNESWGTPSFCVTEEAGLVTIITTRLKATVDPATGSVSYFDSNDQAILSEAGKTLTPATVEGVSTQRVQTIFDSPADEGLFGLGQHQDGIINRKGTNRRLLNANTEISVPLLVSSRGYGLLWDNYSASDFFGGEAGNTQYRYVSEAGDRVDYYFFYGPSIDEVIAGYRTATGEAPLFPKWAYGLFQSKDKYESQAELLSVRDGYRNNDIPVDAIVQDWDYWNPYAWGSHLMDEARYPDPAALVADLHASNVHAMISIWPLYRTVNPERRADELDNYEALDAIGALFPTSGSHHFYDPFDAAARQIVYQQIYDRLLGSYGWDAIWADNTEPQAYPDPVNVRAADTALGKGALYINAYPLQHSKALYEGWRSVGPSSKRVYNLTRSAFAGQQRYAAASWSGDIDSDFPTLVRQVPAGLGFSISGIPYWTTDIGGYWGHTLDWTLEANNELFTRWFQFGAFCPIFRIHGGGSRELYSASWSDATKANLLTIDTLRYRLIPYVYSLAWRVTAENYTMLRHLVFDYRDDPSVFDVADQFLFGPAFLVNPVLSVGATSRSVYLPGGTWYDFWTGATTSGGGMATVSAPLSEIPLLVKAGSIVPMGPNIQYATESADPLEIRVYEGTDGSFTLYEDAGDTYDYEAGQHSQIRFDWSEATRQLTIGARVGSFGGMLMNRTFNIVWVSAGHGAGVGVTAAADASIQYDGSRAVVTAP